jgi:hypothetical protein
VTGFGERRVHRLCLASVGACHPEPRRRRGTSPTAVEELLPQIFPQRIQRPDQRIFLFAAPTLDLFLSCDGIANITVIFVVDEAIQLGLLCKTLNCSILVLANAPLEIIRHARVQDDSTAIGHHINEEDLHSICGVSAPPTVAVPSARLGMTVFRRNLRSMPPLQGSAFAQLRQQFLMYPVKATVAENRDNILRLQQRHESLHNMSHIRLVKSRPA